MSVSVVIVRSNLSAIAAGGGSDKFLSLRSEATKQS